MTTAETRKIRIENNGGESAAGVLHMKRFSKKERVIRALQGLGLMWALAIATAFIPLAHFVLVPGFLIAGPVMAILRYRVTESAVNATGECPTCHQAVTIPLEPSARLPLWTYCPASNDPIQLLDGGGAGTGERP